MIATHHRKQTLGVRELAPLNVFHPGPIHADRDVVLRLASDRTSMASNTAPIINNEAEIRQGTQPITI